MGKVKNFYMEEYEGHDVDAFMDEIYAERDKQLNDLIRNEAKLRKEVEIMKGFLESIDWYNDYLLYRKDWIALYGPKGERKNGNQ